MAAHGRQTHALELTLAFDDECQPRIVEVAVEDEPDASDVRAVGVEDLHAHAPLSAPADVHLPEPLPQFLL